MDRWMAPLDTLEREMTTIPTSKTIVIFGSENIFSASIKVLLSAKVDWEIVNVCNKAGWEALNSALETVRPDTVVIHQESLEDPTSLVMQLLQDHPTIRVIVINLESNLMNVYSKQNIFAQGISNLFQVIENAPDSLSG